MSSGTSLFGQPQNTTQNNTGSLFGNTTQQNSTTGTSLFNNTTQNNTGGLFSNTTQQNSTSLFGNTTTQPATGTSLFSNQTQNNNQNNNLNLTFSSNGQMIQSQPIITSQKPLIALQTSNSMRYSKIESFNEEIKKAAQKIQIDLTNNSMHISYAEKLIKKLEENFNIVKTEGIKVVKYSKVVNTKNTKIKVIINNLKNEIKHLDESLEKEKNNYRILESGSDLNITIPNNFLLTFTQELEDRMISYSSQIEDIQTLINLYYSEENGSFTINSDIVEELIIELYKCIKILLNDEAVLNDYVTSIQRHFIDLLRSYGFNDYQIKGRFDSYLEEDK